MPDSIALAAREVRFFSRGDERAFFGWLDSISCVRSIKGQGSDILISIEGSEMADDDLRELIAVFWRYHVDMKQLRVFVTEANRSWFAMPGTFWHTDVFVVA